MLRLSIACVAFMSNEVWAGGEYCTKPTISIERKDLGPKEVAKRCHEVASFLGYKALPRGNRCTLCEAKDVRTAPGPGVGGGTVGGGGSAGGTGSTVNAKGLAAGYYAVKMTGSGFRKKRTDKAWRKLAGSAEQRSGSEVFVVRVSKGGTIEIGDAFGSYVTKRKSAEATSSAKMCKASPPRGLRPSRPDIWSQGPEFSLLGGPMTIGKIRKAYGCAKKDSGKRSVICNQWKVKKIAYVNLPGHCQ